MEAQPKLQLYFFVAFFLLILGVAFLVFQPYLSALAVAAVFAALTYPVYKRTLRVLKLPSLAAFLTTLFLIVAVAFPISIVGVLLVDELRDVSLTLATGQTAFEGVVSPIEAKLKSISPTFSLNADSIAREVVSWLGRNVGSAFSTTAHALLGILVGLIAYFFFLRDGERFIRFIVRFSPLSDTYDNQILSRLSDTIHAVIQGALLIALIQGLLAGLGMFIFGVPNPILGGAIAALGALLPGIGTGLVLIPAILYLVFVGNTAGAIGLTIWGFIIVGLVDNILLPKLMSRGVMLHPLFILLSVLGGIALFGASGILLGPLVLSLLYALGEIYFVLIAPNKSASVEGSLKRH